MYFKDIWKILLNIFFFFLERESKHWMHNNNFFFKKLKEFLEKINDECIIYIYTIVKFKLYQNLFFIQETYISIILLLVQ